MKTLLKPYWILIIVILPQVILVSLFSSVLTIIKSLLSEDNIRQLIYFAVGEGVAILAFTTYSLILIKKKQKINGLLVGATLIVYYSTYLLIFVFNGNMLPWGIPRWMVSRDDLFLYTITFIMPAIIYGLLLIVIHFTKEDREYSLKKNFLALGSIPLFWYLFYLVIIPFLNNGAFDFYQVTIIFFLASSVIFLFLLARIIYIIITRKAGSFKRWSLIMKILFGILFPVMGLLFNESYFSINMFGDFSSPFFYIIAVVNGIFLCLPSSNYPKVRLFLYFLKCVTFSYTLYFFVVFLPIIPVSLLAIIVFGVGLLLLTPSVLLVLHIYDLNLHYIKLKETLSAWKLTAIGILGFLAIPLFISGYFIYDKMNLHRALNYVYQPELGKAVDIDISSLSTVLDHIKSNKDSRGFFSNQNQIPYLSGYYNWLVLDNLTLSSNKINLLERLFLGKSPVVNRDIEFIRKDTQVEITNWNTRSQYEPQNNCWRTWVDLEIKNKQDFNLAEYSTQIHLPEGCWVSNYYLWVNGKKKFGLLAEKKTAKWIFQEIRTVNQDPGIIHYEGDNNLVFRVFPFTSNEKRKTGIEFIHYEPLEIVMDGHKIQLGNGPAVNKVFTTEEVLYIPKNVKSSLPKIKRKPYLHFIVDCSKKGSANSPLYLKGNMGAANTKRKYTTAERPQKYIQLVNQFIAKKIIDENGALISFVNYKSETYQLKDTWQLKLKNEVQFEGGFFPERVIKEALISNYMKSSNTYPVFIMVSDNLANAISTNTLCEIAFTYPEGSEFYALRSNGSLDSYSFSARDFSHVQNENITITDTNEVFAWPDLKSPKAFLPGNEEGAIIVKEMEELAPIKIDRADFENGLSLQAKWRKMNINPHQTDKIWLPLIRDSFKSKILSPVTSYLVLETEAQEQALLAKQKQVLAAKNTLDIPDEEVQMSEPELWLLLALVCLMTGIRAFKKTQLKLFI